MRGLLQHAVFRNPSVLIGGTLLLILLAIAVAAPLLSDVDPRQIAPRLRLQPPSEEFLMGTDMYGRDVWTRILYGSRISLIVGASVAVLSLTFGMFIGLLAGYFRWLDGPIMRAMDGLMAIPGVLLAIALVSLSGASLLTVIVAITIPAIPSVARVVRGVVLSVREEPFVEAAMGLGTPPIKILLRHITPNTFAPLIVQGTYICAAAVLGEAVLSFLGVGLPAEIPTWGNIIADGRAVFVRAPWTIFFPGIFLGASILAINILGDGLRDSLDPRMKKQVSDRP